MKNIKTRLRDVVDIVSRSNIHPTGMPGRIEKMEETDVWKCHGWEFSRIYDNHKSLYSGTSTNLKQNK